MQETAAQYTRRILDNVEGKQPFSVQESTAEQIAKLMKLLSKRQLSRRPEPGKWSIAEIVAHLADAELVGGWRLRQILACNGVTIQAFDQNAWASTFDYAHRDPKRSLETFRVLRENNLALLKSVPKALWDNYGMHQERGKETVGHIVRMFAGHDVNHLKQIKKIADSYRSR